MANQPVISYADPTVGAVFFNITPPERSRAVDENIAAAQARRESDQAAREYPLRLAAYVDAHHRSLTFHEWCHILQALLYPGLFLRCTREMALATSILSAIRADPAAAVAPRLGLNDVLQEMWTAQLQPYRIDIGEDGEDHSAPAPPGGRRRPSDLTENDLLEDDACAFQYKAEIGAPGTGAGYAQWLSERRRYTMTFRLLARLLGQESAFVALPVLVRQAFSTTLPLPAFAAALAYTVREGRTLPQQLGPDTYLTMVRGALSRALEHGLPEPGLPADADPPLYLDAEAQRAMVERNPFHPLWPLAQRLWGEDGEVDQIGDLLLHPYRGLDRRRDTVDPALERYWPPLTVVRLLHPDVPLRDGVAIVSGEYADLACPFMPDLTYPTYLQTMLSQRYLAMSLATATYDTVAHNCHHAACPWYPANLCRRWLKVPERLETCEFPEFARGATHRQLDAASLSLVRASP
jgi:hypothetical protein